MKVILRYILRHCFRYLLFLEKNKRYKDAVKYIGHALPIVSQEEKEKYEWYARLYAQEYNNQQNLERLCNMSVPIPGTVEWNSYMEQLANAYSLLMTLWPVDDLATQKLMVEFYKNLIAGDTKIVALRKAQDYIKTLRGYESPVYWAGFILLDGID